MSDTLIADVLLYDGTGRKPYCADILLRDDKILQIEPAAKVAFPAAKKILLKNCSISPGWIDVHAHSDVSVLASPGCFGKITQGITTEISGNCGLSAFPILNDEVRAHLQTLYATYDIPLDWSDFDSYAQRIEAVRPAVNQVFLCGHNTLRASVLGYKEAQPSPAQLNGMCALLKRMLSQGAAGVSSGLLYTPGCFSKEAELLALLKVTAEERKIYATHLRNEGDRLEEALDEAVHLCVQSGCALQVSHLKTALPRNWHKLDSVLKKIEKARENGISVHADRYPYTYSQTSLSIVLSEPFDRMTDRDIQKSLQEPSIFQKTLLQLESSGRNWDRVILSSCTIQKYSGLCGKTVAGAAKTLNTSPARFVMELLKADAPGIMGAFGGMSEENLKRILLQDWVCCGTDETARPADYSIGKSHPRGFGSFPRFIRMLRTEGVPMEKIIRKITALPAQIFHLHDRGILAPGMSADLTVFDESLLMDTAGFSSPHSPAAGIQEVWINGVPSLHGDTRSGRLLKINNPES